MDKQRTDDILESILKAEREYEEAKRNFMPTPRQVSAPIQREVMTEPVSPDIL